MASPSPAPWPSLDARWKRSNSRPRSASGMPGPLSSTARLTRLATASTLIRTWPPGPGVAAGVVHQHAREPVDPFGWRADQRGRRGIGVGHEGDRARPGDRAGTGSRTCRRSWPRRAAHRRVAAAGSRTGPATASPRRSGAAACPRPGSGSAPPGTRPRCAGWPARCPLSALITLSGVRSSCDASAVNSSCRRCDCSTGPSAFRPTVSEPRNMASQQQRGRRDLAAQQDRFGMPVLGQALARDYPLASGAPGGQPEGASPR